ncbi:MAG: hypothetical protein Kow0037_26990 [Calditrichia bacterium]
MVKAHLKFWGLIVSLVWINGYIAGCQFGRADAENIKTVSFSGENVKVSEFLKTVSSQTGIDFVFNDSLVLDKTISCNLKNENLTNVIKMFEDSLKVQAEFFNERMVILKKQSNS